MGDFKQNCAIETIKQQCNALRLKGYRVDFVLNKNEQNKCCVHIHGNGKIYRFSDPDLDIIIRQICVLQ